MLGLEVHAFVGLVLFTFCLWDVDSPARRARPGRTPRASRSSFRPTTRARRSWCRRSRQRLPCAPAHETWVLDDGRRPEIASWRPRSARRTSRGRHTSTPRPATSTTRSASVDADIIGVLDADHVATPDFLAATLGYFADRRVALVQTPQDFYNVTVRARQLATHMRRAVTTSRRSSTVSSSPARTAGTQPSGAGPARSSGSRRSRDVGGVATDTITEDIHTTIRMHRAGWKTVYHNEVLARGLAAGNADQYQLQRYRWGTGAMQVLRSENPFFVSRPEHRPAPRVHEDAARLVRLVADARLPAPAAGRAPDGPSRSSPMGSRSPSSSGSRTSCSRLRSSCSVVAPTGRSCRSCSTWSACRRT